MSGIVLLEPKEEEEALSAEAAAFRAKWQAASGEEDAPPPLQWQSQSATAPHADVRTAATQPAKAPAPPAGVRRGFFDAPRGRAAPKAPELISLKAPAKTGPVIPDFLKIPPSAAAAARAQLVEALAPTEDLMQRILSDPKLLAAFDDPQVMAAVSEVAQDPSAFQKHAHNPRVRAFYAAMSGMAGEQLEKVGAVDAKSDGASREEQRPAPPVPPPPISGPRIVELS